MTQKLADREIVRAGLIRCGQIQRELDELKCRGSTKPDDEKLANLRYIEKYILDCISVVHYMKRQAIMWHYIHRWTWEVVAEKMSLSASRIRAIATEGLDEIANYLKQDDDVWAFCIEAVKGDAIFA